MSKVEPTAGEWDYARGSVIVTRTDGVKRDIAAMVSGGTYGPTPAFVVDLAERDANGRLFAASKDLLAACEEALALLHLVGSPTDPIQSSVEHMARAAVAKAKGEA